MAFESVYEDGAEEGLFMRSSRHTLITSDEITTAPQPLAMRNK